MADRPQYTSTIAGVIYNIPNNTISDIRIGYIDIKASSKEELDSYISEIKNNLMFSRNEPTSEQEIIHSAHFITNIFYSTTIDYINYKARLIIKCTFTAHNYTENIYGILINDNTVLFSFQYVVQTPPSIKTYSIYKYITDLPISNNELIATIITNNAQIQNINCIRYTKLEIDDEITINNNNIYLNGLNPDKTDFSSVFVNEVTIIKYITNITYSIFISTNPSDSDIVAGNVLKYTSSQNTISATSQLNIIKNEHIPIVVTSIFESTQEQLIYTEDSNYIIDTYKVSDFIGDAKLIYADNKIYVIFTSGKVLDKAYLTIYVRAKHKTHNFYVDGYYKILVYTYSNTITLLSQPYILTTNDILDITLFAAGDTSISIIPINNSIINTNQVFNLTSGDNTINIQTNASPGICPFIINGSKNDVLMPAIIADTIIEETEVKHLQLSKYESKIICNIQNTGTISTICFFITPTTIYYNISDVQYDYNNNYRSYHVIPYDVTDDTCVAVYEKQGNNIYLSTVTYTKMKDITLYTGDVTYSTLETQYIDVSPEYSFRDKKSTIITPINVLGRSTSSFVLITKEISDIQPIESVKLLVYGNKEIKNCTYYIIYPSADSYNYNIEHQIIPMNLYIGSANMPYIHVINNEYITQESYLKSLFFKYNIYSFKLKIEYTGKEILTINNISVIITNRS